MCLVPSAPQIGDNGEVTTRILGPLALCATLFLAACADNTEELSALEERVAELERVTAGSSESSNTDVVNAGRTLQDGSNESPSEEAAAGDTQEEGDGQEEDVVVALPADADLLDAAQDAFQSSPFLGESDPEFGGTNLVGTAEAVTISMVRAGLEDKPLLENLLLALGFGDGTLAEILDTADGSGDAVTDSGSHALTWANNPEGSEVVIQQS